MKICMYYIIQKWYNCWRRDGFYNFKSVRGVEIITLQWF